MWETIDKSESKVMLNIHKRKCQAETVEEILKSLLKSQQYTVNVRFFNVYVFLLEMHFFNVLNLEKETEKELMSVNVIYQQFNKIAL